MSCRQIPLSPLSNPRYFSRVIELPQRPQRSSRAMLIFCAIVFIALSGILIFLNRAGAKKKEEPAAQSTSMTTPATNTNSNAKKSDEDLKKKLTPEQYRVTQMCGTEP